MEYIDAGDLSELMERRHLSIGESLQVAQDIGSALEYLHGMNILHRDLKPANIMIKEPFKAILMDFNLAFSDQHTVLTEEGFTVGTPRFMAPELFLGVRSSEKSDLFSLGLILHDLLSGGAISSATISVKDLTNRVIKLPSSFNHKVSADLDKLVIWATNNDPELRCPSMKVFLEVLTDIQSGETPSKLPESEILKTESARKPEKKISTRSAGKPKVGTSTDKSSLSRGRRTLPALAAIMVCLAIMFQLKYSALDRILTVLTSFSTELMKMSEKDSPLIQLARNCMVHPLEYEALRAFSKEENRIFEVSRESLEELTSHCNTLRTALNRVRQGTFRIFLESRLRHRQEICQQKNGPNRFPKQSVSPARETKATELIRECYEKYWEGLNTKTSEIRPQDLATGNLFFFELWQQIKKDKDLTTALADKSIERFLQLPLILRRKPEGKAMFHSLLLCKLINNRELIPADSNVLYQPPPYDNEYMKALRLNLSGSRSEVASGNKLKTDKATVASPIEFEESCRRGLAKSLIFLREIRIKKDKLKMTAPKRDIVGFLAPSWKLTDHVAAKFKEVIRAYTRHIHLAWYIMHLADDRSGWDVFLMSSIRDCLKYSWYGFHHIFARQFRKLGKLNPASREFTRTYSRYWQDAALNHVDSSKLSHLGFTVCSYNDISKDIASLNDLELKKTFLDFIESVRDKSPDTGLALKILASTVMRTKPPTPLETRAAFDRLFKLEESISIDDFDGWAALMCIVSNEMFIGFKRQDRNKERALLSVVLLKKIAKYHKDGRFITHKQAIGKYANAESLKQSTLLHCCDAYLTNGNNFLKDQSELAKKLSASISLTLLTQVRQLNTAAGGGIGAQKIMDNEVLDFEDLVINPLRYR